MTSGSESSNGTARTADERKKSVAGAITYCTCEQDDAFVCARCQSAHFAQQVQTTEVSVGGQDCKTRLVERINGGSFGEIYLGTIQDNSEEVAVKIERQDSSSQQQLLYEGNVYRNLEGGPGIPKVHWFGMYGTRYNALVMDLMGPSLHELFKNCKHKFSLKTVVLLLDQMIDVIEHVHCQNYVHRDISPNNFMIGRGQNRHKIFLIDYGHAKKYSTGHQIRPSRNVVKVSCSLVGTPRYASVHAHLGHEPARRDDLEAIGYLLVYLLKGKLPWQGLDIENMQEKLRIIAQQKMKTPMSALCSGLPEEFAIYLDYTRQLKQHDPPEYAGIKDLFRNLARKHNFQYDKAFDWTIESSPPVPENHTLAQMAPGFESACSPISV